MKFYARKAFQPKSVFLFVSTLAVFSAISSQAYEYKETNEHAAKVDAGVAAGSYVGSKAAKYLGKEAPALTTKVLMDSQVGERLTRKKIEEIMTAVKNSPSSFWTLGERGGGELKIRLDLNQYDNYLATENVDHLAGNMRQTAKNIAGIDHTLNGSAHGRTGSYAVSQRPTGVAAFSGQVEAVNRNFKPRWGEITINVGKSGLDGTGSQLERVFASGAAIERVTLQSVISHSALPGALELVSIALNASTYTHALSAGYRGAVSLKNWMFSDNDAVCRPQAHCQEPGVVQKAAVSTAPLPAWVPVSGVAKDGR